LVIFSGREEDGRPALARHDRVAERQGRVLDIAATDVEGPGQRVRIGEHERIDLGLGELLLDAGELVGAGLAGDRRPDAP
jgi:hypothetical protein